MKKVLAFILALIIFLVVANSYNHVLEKQIGDYKNTLYYLISDDKFNSIEAAKVCLNNKDSDNILVLGSSELSSFNTSIMNNGNSNFNMYIVGRGYTQSLQSALTLGAIQNATGIKKVVLILSPQWFEAGGKLNSEIFSSRFQKGTFNMFMKNDKISSETKQRVIEKLKELEIEDELELQKIVQYENAYLKHNLIDKIQLTITEKISESKQNKKLLKFFKENEIEKDIQSDIIKFEEYDFDKLLEEATRSGTNACTNNDFGVYDDYYDTYMKDGIELKKDTSVNSTFSNNEEYEYFELFLQICNELEIQPLIVNVPVNGRWYDYIGFSKVAREEYYNKILDIANRYNAKVADFSNCEYEMYFLKDIMHLGWRGWVKVDEEIYKYYYE